VEATNDLDNPIQLDISSTDESRDVLRPELAGNITFSNVQFSYPERPEATILKNVNLTIEDGECVVIVACSGSGKSTIASLLQHLYEPSSGSVAIGLNDLCDVEIKHLRDHVSVVSQHPNLFDATIAENIRYGDPAECEVDIRHAAKAAHLHEFIMSLLMAVTHWSKKARL
jgi:ATP-binding cassette subfamily B (MDR/TAP) protein 1